MKNKIIKKGSDKLRNFFCKYKNKNDFLNEVIGKNIKHSDIFIDEERYLNLTPYQKERYLFEMIKSCVEKHKDDDFEMEA